MVAIPDKSAVDLGACRFIREAQGRQLFEDGLNEAFRSNKREPVPRRLPAIVRKLNFFLLNAEHTARRVDASLDFHLGSHKRIQQIWLRGERRLVEGQIAKQLDEGRFSRQAHSADRARRIENRQTFQNVVDLIEPHRQPDDRACRRFATMRELSKP